MRMAQINLVIARVPLSESLKLRPLTLTKSIKVLRFPRFSRQGWTADLVFPSCLLPAGTGSAVTKVFCQFLSHPSGLLFPLIDRRDDGSMKRDERELKSCLDGVTALLFFFCSDVATQSFSFNSVLVMFRYHSLITYSMLLCMQC
jgi:hypothetical protein